MLVNPFCISPTLLNKIKLAVEFWQEDNLNAAGSAVGLKHTLNLNKIGLVEQSLAATTVCSSLVRTLEIQTLGQETLFWQASFLHYYLHALK